MDRERSEPSAELDPDLVELEALEREISALERELAGLEGDESE